MTTCKWLCQHMVKWWGWFTAPKQWTPVLWTHLSLPPKRSKICLETFPQSRVGIKMASLFSLHFWPHSQDVKIYHTSCHQVSYPTRSFKSTPLCLPTGWIFISYQSKLTISTKIFTHNSKSDIFVSCISSEFDGKSAAHIQPSFLQVFNSTSGAFNWF